MIDPGEKDDFAMLRSDVRPNFSLAGKNFVTLCKSELTRLYIPVMIDLHSWKGSESWRKDALTTMTNQIIHEHGAALWMVGDQCGWRNRHQADLVHYLTSGDLGWFIAEWLVKISQNVSYKSYLHNQLNLYSKHHDDPNREGIEYGEGSLRFACGIYAAMFADNLDNKEAQRAKLFAGYHSKQSALWPGLSDYQILNEFTNALQDAFLR